MAFDDPSFSSCFFKVIESLAYNEKQKFRNFIFLMVFGKKMLKNSVKNIKN